MNRPIDSNVLLIDIGNSRIKLNIFDAANGQRDLAVLNLAHSELDTIGDRLRKLNITFGSALGVNVAGAAMEQALDQRVQAASGVPATWVRSQARHGELRNSYGQPEQLGADRWVALIGLAAHTASACDKTTPAMLASFGTATTIDTLGTDSVFHGGLILPGPDMMLESLASNTANLPSATGVPTDFPRHTHQAIVSGVAAAQAGAVLRQWRVSLEEFGAPARIYVTGGAWPKVEQELRLRLAMAQADLGLADQKVIFLSHPVLDGLACLAMQDRN